MGAWLTLAMAFASAQPQGPVPIPPTRLFADDRPIQVRVSGPIAAIVATPAPSRPARPATLTLVSPAAESHSILLSPRGLTRRLKESCTFPPLRVQFASKPSKGSMFERQKRLKLVTHCRSPAGHQQYVLLEYAAYRMFNAIHPTGLRVRLGTFDYAEQNGRSYASRLGFFIEDPDDAASRNRLKEVRISTRIAAFQLDAAAAARAALFEYMIGNVDWSMRAGPAGDVCCHNFRLFGLTATAQSALIPVPYDFDASGLVNTPYAVPPDGVGLSSVRERRYRGYCIHNGQALAVAGEFRTRKAELLGVLASVPGLDEGRRQRAAAYLESFFQDIATDDQVTRKVLKTCIN